MSLDANTAFRYAKGMGNDDPIDYDGEPFSDFYAGWQAATEAAKPAQEEDSQIRWCADGQIFGRPTATDALEYAEQRLRDPEEMNCCKSDVRLDAMHSIRKLLSAAKATGTAGELSPLPEGKAWASPLRYGSKIGFPKPVKPANWDDDDGVDWFCHPYFTADQMREYGNACAQAALASYAKVVTRTDAKIILPVAEAARQPAPVVAVSDYEVDEKEAHYDMNEIAFAAGQWAFVTRPGMVQKGDKLRFMIGDKEYHEKAKLILHPGTDKEEVVYHIGNNFYFITSMVIDSKSNHKGVEVMRPSKGQP